MKSSMPMFIYMLGSCLIFPLISHANEPPLSLNGKYMTGDWDGLRTDLKKEGYDFTLEYNSMIASNIAGGYDRDKTVRYSDQYTLGVDLNMQKIAGINDGEFKFSLIDRNGRDLSADRLQDPRVPVIGSNVNSNYGRGQTWHIAQFWYRQSWFDKKFDLKLGMMPVGEDFDNNGCYFQNLSLCGSLAGHGAGVWYNTPVGQWGMRLRYNIAPDLYIQTAAFQYNPYYATRKGSFQLDSTGHTGSMYVTELGYLPKIGAQRLPGLYKIGAWYNSANANDVLKDDDGDDYVLSKRSPRVHDGRYGGYINLRQQVTAANGDVRRGLSLFGHLAMYDKDTATITYQTQVGAIYKGIFASRPDDYVGLGFSKMHVNSKIARRAELLNEIKGIDDYDNPGYSPVRDAEYLTELDYNVAVTPWLTIRPNLQLLVHPGGVTEIKDAWVIGSQLTVQF